MAFAGNPSLPDGVSRLLSYDRSSRVRRSISERAPQMQADLLRSQLRTDPTLAVRLVSQALNHQLDQMTALPPKAALKVAREELERLFDDAEQRL